MRRAIVLLFLAGCASGPHWAKPGGTPEAMQADLYLCDNLAQSVPAAPKRHFCSPPPLPKERETTAPTGGVSSTPAGAPTVEGGVPGGAAGGGVALTSRMECTTPSDTGTTRKSSGCAVAAAPDKS